MAKLVLKLHACFMVVVYIPKKNPDQIKCGQDRLFPSRLITDKRSQSCAKIVLHCKNCTIAGKRQNCAAQDCNLLVGLLYVTILVKLFIHVLLSPDM